MRFRNFLLASLIAFSAPMMVGCGASCEDLCDKVDEEDCDSISSGECSDICDAAEELNEKEEDCEEDFDKFLECADDAGDICDVFALEDCDDEFEDYADCLVDYCQDHTTNDSCQFFFTDL